MTQLPRVGTLEWANETQGQLRPQDYFALLVNQTGPALIGLLFDSVRVPLGLYRPIALPPELIIPYVESLIPDTPIAEAASDLCRSTSDQWLLDHCYRTFAFGVLLGHDLSFNAEILFAGAMLHDIGLTSTFQQGAESALDGYSRRDAPCFAVRGADVAERLAATHRRPSACSVAVAEAICSHLNVRVKQAEGVEAHLLNYASALDVLRLRLRKLPRHAVGSVDDRWRRGDDFCENLLRAWTREAAHRNCRAQFLSRGGVFSRMVRRSCWWKPNKI
jgi:hypothetical protein